MNKLVVNMGNFKLDEVPLTRGSINIGRAPDNDISLADPATSSHHAKIVTIFTSSFIQDLNSTNGTIVNGRKIVRHTLHHGDIISIGNLQLMFKSDGNVSSHTEQENKTITLDKKELKELKSLTGNGELPVIKKKTGSDESSGEKLSGFSISIPDTETKAKSNEDTDIQLDAIPTLDETLPLDELRKNPNRTVVVNADNVDAIEGIPTQKPGAPAITQEDIMAENQEVEEILITEYNSDYTTDFLDEKETENTQAPDSAAEFDPNDEDIKHLLMNDQMDNRSRMLAKYAIGVVILGAIILSIYLLV